MRRVTVGAVVNNWRMLPEERTALFRVARIARLIYRFLCQQLRSGGTVRVVAVRTGDLTFKDRMAREAMNLRALVLVAAKADFRLRELAHHLLVWIVRLVAIGTGEPVCFMGTACPQSFWSNLAFVAGEASGIAAFDGGLFLRFGAEDYVRGAATGIFLVLRALAMATLATGSARIAFDSVLRLINRQHGSAPALVVAHRALLVAFQGPIGLCFDGHQASQAQCQGTSR